MTRDLIYDVGVHLGYDTANYLERGFRVVAIDADPRMISHCRERFATELANGRLTLLNIGISDQVGVLPFYRSEHDDWSSFDPALARRNGTYAEELLVECVPFEEIIAMHGVPYYLKIDIEGRDLCCIQGLSKGDLPEYLSCEMYSTDILCHLRGLGYSRFKLVDQRSHFGLSSGPFGEEAIGPWRTVDDLYYEWMHLTRGYKERCQFIDPSPEAWWDVHAAR